jgi:hypothetical protein
MILFLPVHFFLHRVNPTTPEPPISAVGPAELDFEFVKYGLRHWPWRSWALYAGLVVCVGLHATDGVYLICNKWLGDVPSWWKRRSKRYRRGVTVAGLILPVLSGLFVLSKEPLMIFSFKAKRFKAVFIKSFLV